MLSNKSKYNIGNIDIIKLNIPYKLVDDLYHKILTMSWPATIFLFWCGYICVNLIFASIYYWIGDGIPNTDGSFIQYFFFSVHTLSTIGYGYFHPSSNLINIIVTFESFFGILNLGIVTGLMFNKFSRPTAKVIFSKNVLINHLNSQRVLQFRVANIRANQITDAKMVVNYIVEEKTAEGSIIHKMYDLDLVRSHSHFFSLSWTLFHNIDEKSPFYNCTMESLKKLEFQLICTLSGVDNDFNQKVNKRHFYKMDDIIIDKQFEDVLSKQNDSLTIDMSKFDKMKS